MLLLSKTSFPTDFELSEITQNYGPHDALKRLIFLLLSCPSPPPLQLAAVQQIAARFRTLNSTKWARDLAHLASSHPLSAAALEALLQLLPWADKCDQALAGSYQELYASAQRAQQAGDRAQYFVLNDSVGSFMYSKGDFALAQRIFTQSAGDYHPDAFPRQHVLSLVQSVRCHFASDAFEAAGEVADRTRRLLGSSAALAAQVPVRLANAAHAAAGVVAMRRHEFAACASALVQVCCFSAEEEEAKEKEGGEKGKSKDREGVEEDNLSRIPDSSSTTTTSSLAPDFLSFKDIGLYAVLAAAASFDRAAIQAQLLQNLSFFPCVEENPLVEAFLRHFYHNRFAQALPLLDQILQRHAFDLHLHLCRARLQTLIIRKAIVRHISCFSRVDLTKMAHDFGVSSDSLEDEIVHLIQQGDLSGKLDLLNNVFVTVVPTPHEKLIQQGLKSADHFLNGIESQILRIAWTANVTSKNSQPSLLSFPSSGEIQDAFLQLISNQS